MCGCEVRKRRGKGERREEVVKGWRGVRLFDFALCGEVEVEVQVQVEEEVERGRRCGDGGRERVEESDVGGVRFVCHTSLSGFGSCIFRSLKQSCIAQSVV